jgi:hypothetical protein
MSQVPIEVANEPVQENPPRWRPTPVPDNLKKVLVAVNDSKQAEYAFNWMIEYL